MSRAAEQRKRKKEGTDFLNEEGEKRKHTALHHLCLKKEPNFFAIKSKKPEEGIFDRAHVYGKEKGLMKRGGRGGGVAD